MDYNTRLFYIFRYILRYYTSVNTICKVNLCEFSVNNIRTAKQPGQSLDIWYLPFVSQNEESAAIYT